MTHIPSIINGKLSFDTSKPSTASLEKKLLNPMSNKSQAEQKRSPKPLNESPKKSKISKQVVKLKLSSAEVARNEQRHKELTYVPPHFGS